MPKHSRNKQRDMVDYSGEVPGGVVWQYRRCSLCLRCRPFHAAELRSCSAVLETVSWHLSAASTAADWLRLDQWSLHDAAAKCPRQRWLSEATASATHQTLQLALNQTASPLSNRIALILTSIFYAAVLTGCSTRLARMFVCLSVCPSVRPVRAPNSTKHRKRKLAWTFPMARVTGVPIVSSKGQS